MINTKRKYLFQEAYELHQSGNLNAAAEFYSNILKEEPDNINVIFLTGTLNLQQGNLDAACMLFRKTLELSPDLAIAYSNLGIALYESGKIDEAIRCYRKAIILKPNDADTHFNLGNALKDQIKPEEAIISYKHAIELRPNDSGLYGNLGNTLREQGKLSEAVEYYRKASELEPDNAGFQCNLGAALQETGKADDAIECYKQATTIDPNYAMAHSNLGSIFQEIDKPVDAITNFKKAIILKPDYAEAYNNLGSSLLELGKPGEAVEYLNKAISLKPDNAESYNNLGIAFLKLGKPDEAVEYHNKAISLKANFAEAHNNLGTALMEQCKFDAAIISHKKAIELKPDYAEAYNNLGAVLKESGEPLEAIEKYKLATELDPHYVQAHLNMAFALLLTENFRKGWQEYEWRLRVKGQTPKTTRKPMWNGSSLNGRSILVSTEQGLGDSIQFIRYIPMVKKQGGRVIVECQQSLRRLFKNCDGIDEIKKITSDAESSIQFDVHVPLLSLPGIFDVTMDLIPSNGPYIKSDPVLISKWRTKLDYDNNFKIGIVWAGNPEHKNDSNRSCSLKNFAHLTDIRGLTLFSLQKGPASVESNNPPGDMKIINLTNELNDFAETAAVIDNLDLIISADTSVAHLAGAIGKPVWVLLPFVPDWRWFLKRNDSPWYPNMRLFRQHKPHDWQGVFEQVKKALISNFGLQIAECGRKTVC